MKILNFDTKEEAIETWKELYNTGFKASDLIIQYNGCIRCHQLIINNEDDSYRPDFVFDN